MHRCIVFGILALLLTRVECLQPLRWAASACLGAVLCTPASALGALGTPVLDTNTATKGTAAAASLARFNKPKEPGPANILTKLNPLLEGIRRAEQLDADESDAQGTNSAVLLLVPIVTLRADLTTVRSFLDTRTPQGLQRADQVLGGAGYSKVGLKKMFNRFADNIYYADPDRANFYLGGGAVPDSSQTQKYLVRNELLTDVDNLRDDIAAMLKEGGDEQTVLDTVDDCDQCLQTMQLYFGLVNGDDLRLAEEVLASKR
ncbi:hypothetical protein B484DRAFT_443970 [Ochromonadaceae sp. CCMP2298]|nr:hypothetical protein B484DRAFT_443970 [Ochromonadaceae sp. CCMP2298]|mmetsp:Transcript_12235/g.27273  ORF Transcript_12235/g.27273 Transcript_12235/m.27273 type:complete len:260 (+) Transcript_12235:104-883(+)